MADRKKLTWDEAVRYLIAFNQKHNITTKGSGPTCKMVVVIAQSTFTEPYTEVQRSYVFSNHNKYFIPSNIGSSIFADCMDGSEFIRLDDYIVPGNPGSWDVEYCYILEEEGEEVA